MKADQVSRFAGQDLANVLWNLSARMTALRHHLDAIHANEVDRREDSLIYATRTVRGVLAEAEDLASAVADCTLTARHDSIAQDLRRLLECEPLDDEEQGLHAAADGALSSAAAGAGPLPDLPRDLAHALDAELLDVLTLLKAEGDALAGPDDDDGAMHSKESRAVALRAMAADKVSCVIRRMAPYV